MPKKDSEGPKRLKILAPKVKKVMGALDAVVRFVSAEYGAAHDLRVEREKYYIFNPFTELMNIVENKQDPVGLRYLNSSFESDVRAIMPEVIDTVVKGVEEREELHDGLAILAREDESQDITYGALSQEQKLATVKEAIAIFLGVGDQDVNNLSLQDYFTDEEEALVAEDLIRQSNYGITLARMYEGFDEPDPIDMHEASVLFNTAVMDLIPLYLEKALNAEKYGATIKKMISENEDLSVDKIISDKKLRDEVLIRTYDSDEALDLVVDSYERDMRFTASSRNLRDFMQTEYMKAASIVGFNRFIPKMETESKLSLLFRYIQDTIRDQISNYQLDYIADVYKKHKLMVSITPKGEQRAQEQGGN